MITINKRYHKILNEVKSIFPYIEDSEQNRIAKRIYSEGLLPDFMSPTNLLKSIAGEYGTDIDKFKTDKNKKQIMSKIAARALFPDYHNHALVNKVVKQFLIKTEYGYIVDPEIENKLGRSDEVIELLRKFAKLYTNFKDQGTAKQITDYRHRADLGKLANKIQDRFFQKNWEKFDTDKDLKKKFDKLTPSALTPEFWRSKFNINRLVHINNLPMEEWLDDVPEVAKYKEIMRNNPKTSYAYRNALGMIEKHLVQAKATKDFKNNPIGYFFNRTSDSRKKQSKWKGR